jgi:hypothetical protein
MRHVPLGPRKTFIPPLQLSRPLLLLFAAVVACAALIGAISALNQDGDVADATVEAQPRQLTDAAAQDTAATASSARELAIVRASLRGTGFDTAGTLVRHAQDMEIPVRDAAGHTWIAWLDNAGRAAEVEIVDYDEDKVPETPTFNPQDLPGMIAKDGFQARGEAKLRPEHFEIRAINKRQELVELHVDFAGQIYKQVWIR